MDFHHSGKGKGRIFMQVCLQNKWRRSRKLIDPVGHLLVVWTMFLFTLLNGFPTAGGPGIASAETLKLEDILNKVDDLYRGSSSEGKMTMEIVTAHWKRTLSLQFYSKGRDRSLIRILSPLKEKGTATLRSENEVWNFLPKVNRVIKLPSSMMSASWMGSHFTNDDLVKESRFTQDYDFKIAHEGTRNGEEVVELACIPKPNAPVVWGKVEVVVRRKDYLPVLMRYYDEEFQLVRTMTFSNFKEMSGRYLPTVMLLVPEDKPSEKTQVSYDDIRFDVPLSDEVFSLRNLQH
jgi:hypothetical protein